MRNQRDGTAMTILTTQVNNGNANLRNGHIKRVQQLEYWVHEDLNGEWSVMINAGNDRTGLFNGHITVGLEAMVEMSRKFLAMYDEA